MTEDQIERKVEREMDRIDAQLMSGAIDHDQYEEQVNDLDRWAAMEYRRKDGPAPFTAHDRRLDH